MCQLEDILTRCIQAPPKGPKECLIILRSLQDDPVMVVLPAYPIAMAFLMHPLAVEGHHCQASAALDPSVYETLCRRLVALEPRSSHLSLWELCARTVAETTSR